MGRRRSSPHLHLAAHRVLQVTLLLWAAVGVKTDGGGGDVALRGWVAPQDPEKEAPPSLEADVSPGRAGTPTRVILDVKGVLGTGSLTVAAGDGTSVTFLASRYPSQVAAGSPQAGWTDRESRKELTARRGGDNISSGRHEGRPHPSPATHHHSPLAMDTTQPPSPPTADTTHSSPQTDCPEFTMSVDNTDDDSKQGPPAYGVTCRARRGVGLLLEVTHVYTDPARYQLHAHFLDHQLGVVTRRWEAQVEVEELLQVTLGPSQVLPLEEGVAAAHATLTITPTPTHLPLPCPWKDISWTWDFGDGMGEEGDECMRERREKEQKMRTQGGKRSEKGADFLKKAQNGIESSAGLEERRRGEKKEVESVDKRDGERKEATERVSPDSTFSTHYYSTLSPSSFASTTPSSTTTSRGMISYYQHNDSRPPSLHTEISSVTNLNRSPLSTVSSITSTSTTTAPASRTSQGDAVSPKPTTTSTTASQGDATTTIVHHTYTSPGMYNLSVNLLCGCRRITGKNISQAFTVAIPVGDIQISVSERQLVVVPQGKGVPPATQEVMVTVKVTRGSFLQPLTLHTGDGAHLVLQPTPDLPAASWRAKATYTYNRPGEYRPWVEVANPVGGRQVALHTTIKVDQPPSSVVLVPDTYVAAVGEEVVFTAKASGGTVDLLYDWVLPWGERLKDAGPVVSRVYQTPFNGNVSVEVYSAAHAHMPALPRLKAAALVSVQPRLTAVEVFADDKKANVTLQKDKWVFLKAEVTPKEAQSTSAFYWFLNNNNPHHGIDHVFPISFPSAGEVSLYVMAENKVSRVISPEFRALVVEKVGDVRGLADHNSVLALQPRNYTVLVGQGSHITYTWDFGNLHSPVNTTVPTKEHTYWMAGTYTLTVQLTTPLGDRHVVTSKVFVLESGKCDTPEVLGFYPQDFATEREFDGTQEILVEPSLLRDCPKGSGPEYRWKIWNENGEEVQLANHTRLDAPSLLIHPVYDHDWPPWALTYWTKGTGNATDGRDLAASSESGAPRTLEDGKYLTQLTIREKDTIVEAAVNTSFRVIATRLRVIFMDGTEREVDKDSNVTLWVEVTTPTPNYTLSWDCYPQGHPESSCFSSLDIWKTFTTTTSVGDNLFARLYHLWDIIHSNSQENDNPYLFSSGRDSGSSSKSSKSSPPPTEDQQNVFDNVFRTNLHYVETITFPASSLTDINSRFHFSVSVRYHFKSSIASQLVVVKPSRDNIGIQTYLGSQFPFGALRRMVFESECMSCSPEELATLQYIWSLKYLVNNHRVPVGNTQEEVPDRREAALQRSLRRKEPEESFLPRSRDYLRVYNKSALQEEEEYATHDEESSRALSPAIPHLSTRDLQKLPGTLTRDMMIQAAEIYHQWAAPGRPPLSGSGGPHKLPATRQKRSVKQNAASLQLRVKNNSPLQRVADPDMMGGPVSNVGGSEGAREEAGGRERVASTASAGTRRPRHAQDRQMRKDDRMSSTQTNMRPKAIGRHSGAEARGPVTDEAAVPARLSSPAPAKVTFTSHHNHLVHRTANNQHREAGGRGEGAWRGGRSDGEAATSTPAAGVAQYLSRLSGKNTVLAETEHGGGRMEPPDHSHETKGKHGEKEVLTMHEMDGRDFGQASVERGGRSKSRTNEGVKWESVGKVSESEEVMRQDQVVLSKRKVKENEYLKGEEEEGDEDEERRLWQSNDGDHGVRDNQPDGGSERKEERQQMTEAVRAGDHGAGDAMAGASEGRTGKKSRATATTLLPNSQVTAREGSSTVEKAAGEGSQRSEVTASLSTVAATVVDFLKETAEKKHARIPMKQKARSSDLPRESAALHEGQEPKLRRPARFHNPAVLLSLRQPSPPPQTLSPLTQQTYFPFVSSQPQDNEEEQFSPGNDHFKENEWPRSSALQQQRRRAPSKEEGEASVTKVAVEQQQQRAVEPQKRFRGRERKRRKKEKFKIMPKTERREGGKDKGRQEISGDGTAASSHLGEEEVGYKENYLTSRVTVKVDENDAQEGENDKGGVGEARQVARTNRQPAHQHSDSAYTPLRLTRWGLPGEGGTPTRPSEASADASGLPWDALERKQSSVRGGTSRMRGSRPGHSPHAAAAHRRLASPSRPQSNPAVPPTTSPLEIHSPLQASRRPPSPPGLGVQYKKLDMVQPPRRKIDSLGSSGPDRSIGNPTRKAGGRGRDRLSVAPLRRTPPRRADGIAPNHTAKDGMENPLAVSQRFRARPKPSDHVAEEQDDAVSLTSPSSSSSNTSDGGGGPVDTARYRYQTQKTSGWNVGEAAGDGGGRSAGAGRGQGQTAPGGIPFPHTPPVEGRPWAPRGPGYAKKTIDFVRRKGSSPDFNCRPEKWEECHAHGSPTAHINATLTHALGDFGSDSRIMEKYLTQDLFVTEENQLPFNLFGQLTSTGIHKPVLVLYMDLLPTNQNYILYLTTYSPRTNRTGRAKQFIEFSPAPTLRNCQVIPLPGGNGSYFRASCYEVEGHYYPVLLQWSYHFLWLGAKTVFYHGARHSFDFTLPSGLSSNDYKVYISVKAIDGKGVSYRYPDDLVVKVLPKYESGDGVLSIFQDISALENESPPLLLQQVRSLAWELNLLMPSVITQTVLDNILTILFFTNNCKEMLDPAFIPSLSDFRSSAEIFMKVNLLNSCARDHLAETVVNNPMRDEMEVIQALSTLQIIIDTPENISSTTYLRVLSAMNIAAERMWFSYFSQVRTEAAQEYFILSSAMLDKQTDIYDWNSTSIALSTNIITQLLDIMELETRSRFMEEKPLTWSTQTLTFHGYLADAENINRANNSVPFLFKPGNVVFGVHLVQALIHKSSPFNLPVDPVTSEVVTLNIYMPKYVPRNVEVKVRHSLNQVKSNYDFRRDGVLTPDSLSVYEFVVSSEHQHLILHVLLQIIHVLNSENPVAAVLLVCEDLQSLKEPLYKQELMATVDPSKMLLSVPSNGLSTGKKLLVIIDKNSYENNWARHNTSNTITGADFKISAWWSRCVVWDGSRWDESPCSVVSETSSWDITTCSCKSLNSVYGAQTIPVLNEESKMNVNELMLHETYMALYFIILFLVVYFLLALAVQTSDRHRLRRRNIWLRDNRLEHEWAYLLTIKTGTQWNAGTTSKVYAILHGTHGMSETRELQSKQTGQLFTRGALCTFILTTPEALGDILKVQVWHDNSGGSESGWFVCEASVADLVHGAKYVYPCYRWLAVQAEDAKIEREITLESPTTFLQDFEHFLPQYASEHMLWTSLLTTSNTAKLYRLQRLTICLIVCLCMGTVALWVVKRINNEHTMMVPDMHIEPLYYGVIIAMGLLPIQWLLEMVFKMSNKLEEKEYNAKAVLDTLRATNSNVSTSTAETETTQVNSESEDNIYDPQAGIWKNLRSWSLSTELSLNAAGMIHPAVLQDLETDSMEINQRSRTSTGNGSRISYSDSGFVTSQQESDIAEVIEPNDVMETSEESNKKCSSLNRFFPKFLRRLSSQSFIINKAKNKRFVQEEEGCVADDYNDDEDDDEEVERDDLRVPSSITFIFSQCVGWIVCCFFVALCCMVLYVHGSGMPIDYGTLWIHIIYVTLCCSMFIMQPLVVIIYTFYKVCVYRWLGCTGCISSCITVPLDQVVAIWNRYQTTLRRQAPSAPDSSHEKLLEERQRTRELRFAHPPSEDYLLKCRDKEMRREKVRCLLCNTLGHLSFLILLIIIIHNADIYKRYTLNTAIYSSLENGSCLDTARYMDPCTITNGDSCNQIKNENYMTFKDIKTKDDWWKWAYTELLALAYSNEDASYSAYNIFCDSNSIIIGQPRLRRYDSYSQECEASKVMIDNNRSMADILEIGNCFPDYVDQVAHLFSFGSNLDKEYKWDAHFLAVTHGRFSQYSYTAHKQDLSGSRFGTILTFYFLQASNWLNNNGTRAVVTEFTMYHPQTDMYTTIKLLAEFPSLSGAEVTTFVSSSHIERYKGSWYFLCMLAEVILLAIAMHYLNQTTVYIYTCRFRIWKSFWGMLDILMTILTWSYIVCLMLRVQIAEDAIWQLRVAYFQKFVNLKSLTTWDDVLESLIGCIMAIHLLHCLSLVKYLPRSHRLGLILASACKDVKIISVGLLLFLFALTSLGHIWFSTVLFDFHSLAETLLSLFKMVLIQLPFLTAMEERSLISTSYLDKLYYLLTYVLLYQLIRALYVAAFLNAHRTFVDKPRMDVSWKDVTLYVKERYQSLLRKICRKKKEEESQPEDNTPPDFYMAELELQINQVMSGLENLAESLGVVHDKMNRLEHSQSSYMDRHDSEDQLWIDNDFFYHNEEAWLREDSESRSSTPRNDTDALWEPARCPEQQTMQDYDHKLQTSQLQGARPRHVNETSKERKISVDKGINFDAFTEIESCQTEIEALTRKWNSSLVDPPFESVDDGSTLEKFLKDVSESHDNFTSFGKYGKTQLRVNTKVHPSYESLTLPHNNSGVIDGTAPQREELIDIDATAPRGISSRLCRTQTQGRGKGHVDLLDISCLESDYEDDSNC